MFKKNKISTYCCNCILHTAVERQVNVMKMTQSMLICFGPFLAYAVVVWQLVSLVKAYNNPSTSFEVSVSNGHSVGRFERVRISRCFCFSP